MIEIRHFKEILSQSPMGLLHAEEPPNVLMHTACIVGEVCSKAHFDHGVRLVCKPLRSPSRAIGVADNAI